MTQLTIQEIQGHGLFSAYAGQQVTTQGVVTGVLRRGFYIQTPGVVWDGKRSNAIFVFSHKQKPKIGNEVQIRGECVNYLSSDNAKPITQILPEEIVVLQDTGPIIDPLTFSHEQMPPTLPELAEYLNSLEGMLVSIPAGAKFIAPSNLFADYVCALPGQLTRSDLLVTEHGGVIPHHTTLDRWFPGFRVLDAKLAPNLNVGSRLLAPICGPLHYRVNAWQITINHSFEVAHNPITPTVSTLKSDDHKVTILTLNCFNLDQQIEDATKVKNPKTDIDDDWGDGRFHTLADAIVYQAHTPDIVALQEIQDDDGAEISDIVSAKKTYTALIDLVAERSGVTYQWVDIPPEPGADGGQPGGNIRCGFLYDPARVTLDQQSVQLLGKDLPCFVDSRKPLCATFIEKASQTPITVINVHLVSKRQKESVFAPNNAGQDPKESIRVEQAKVITELTQALTEAKQAFYITGDFNDHEHSQTLATLVGHTNTNLVFSLPESERYDYNHRGKLHVLMHGIVPNFLLDSAHLAYEILHGNELVGVTPREVTDKPSDHAYVLCRIDFGQ